MSSTEIEEIDEIVEPSVTSNDPNERKLARRLRIQKRYETLELGDKTEDIAEKTPSEKQILASEDLLDKLVIEANEVISNVRVANDSREIDRRSKERDLRRRLLERLEKDAAECTGKYERINDKWSSIFSSNDPLEIDEAMRSQSAKCLEILDKKNDVINELKSQLKRADEQYELEQQKQFDDVDLLIERIESQVSVIGRAYKRELELIDATVDSDRKALLDDIAKKWDTLFDALKDTEANAVEERKAIMREYEGEILKIVVEHQERHRQQKISLEHECQALLRETQRVKATCMMNIEKLDYSYAVLKYREDENLIIKNQQKRRLNKLQDTLNNLKKSYNELEESTKLEIKRLSDQVMRTHKSITEFERKSKYLTEINEKRFMEIWEMNSKAARELVEKILIADKIIHEETLGIDYTGPDKPLLRKEDLPSYVKAIEAIKQEREKQEAKQNLREPLKIGSTLEDIKMQRLLLNQILRLITNEPNVRLEDSLQNIILPYVDKDKMIVKVDGVLKALNITSQKEVDTLLKYFLPYACCTICEELFDLSKATSSPGDTLSQCACSETESDDPCDPKAFLVRSVREELAKLERNSIECITCTSEGNEYEGEKISEETSSCKSFDEREEDHYLSSSGSETGAKLQCNRGHPLDIKEENVAKALQDFVDKFKESQLDERQLMSYKERLSMEELTISRSITVQDMNDFWASYREVFSKKKEDLWDNLLVALQKYYAILKERHKINAEVDSLQRQNAELRLLMKAYVPKNDKSNSRRTKSAKL